MKKQYPATDHTTALRSRAEQILQHGLSGTLDPAELQPDDIRALFHDLQVHQIELEMQNDELRCTQEALETARDRYTDLFDFAPVGYFTLNKEDKIVEANLTAAQLLRSDRSRLLGMPFSAFVSPESRHHYRRLQRRLESERWSTSDDITLMRSDGEACQVQLNCSNTTGDDSGEIRIAVADIRERKLLEERRDLFFSIASHELRTPVTTLTLALEMLVNSDTGLFSPDQATMLDTAWAGARRLQRLVGEILEMRRTDRGAMNYRTQIVELSPLLRDAVEQCRVLATPRNIELELRESRVELWVDVDADRLVQVMFNLLSNALHFSPRDGRVVIESRLASEHARVSVTDQGPGVPDIFREHVFEPFAQANPSLEDDDNRQHLGLGLSIARNIIQRFGGKIGFSSTPHVATTFYFELPVHRGTA